jgi:hypothetical protein
MLFLLLLPSGILGFLGYDYLYSRIKDTSIHAVGQIADAHHHHLIAMLSSTQHHTTDLFKRLETQCFSIKDASKKQKCTHQLLQEFIASGQAVGVKLLEKNEPSTPHRRLAALILHHQRLANISPTKRLSECFVEKHNEL